MKVTISLKNPPSGANRWGLSLYDWADEEKFLSDTVDSIAGQAEFDIPSDWAWPLRFFISIRRYVSPADQEILYEAQSISPDYPDYIEEFIPRPGSYNYNVAIGQFAVTPTLAGCLPVIIGLAILVAAGGLLSLALFL